MEHLNDHQAKLCECGSAHFNLLRSLTIECSNCGKQFGLWRDLDSEKVFAAMQHTVDLIEKCGASIELTNAVSFASDLMGAFGNKWNAPREHNVKQLEEWEIPSR